MFVQYLPASMGEDRQWMYNGWKKSKVHSKEWFDKTDRFIDRAFSLSDTDVVRCPCNNCRNAKSHDRRRLSLHLCKFGFMPGYEVWVHHGERANQNAPVAEEDDVTDRDRMDEILDAICPESIPDVEDPPTSEVQKFFELLKAVEEPLLEHTIVSVLAFVT